jgi:hypothetical protein
MIDPHLPGRGSYTGLDGLRPLLTSIFEIFTE